MSSGRDLHWICDRASHVHTVSRWIHMPKWDVNYLSHNSSYNWIKLIWMSAQNMLFACMLCTIAWKHTLKKSIFQPIYLLNHYTQFKCRLKWHLCQLVWTQARSVELCYWYIRLFNFSRSMYLDLNLWFRPAQNRSFISCDPCINVIIWLLLKNLVWFALSTIHSWMTILRMRLKEKEGLSYIFVFILVQSFLFFKLGIHLLERKYNIAPSNHIFAKISNISNIYTTSNIC